MALLTPAFSANRTVRQYAEENYIPAAAAYEARSANEGKAAADLLAWQRRIDERWPAVRFGRLETVSGNGESLFNVEVHLAGLDPSDVRVEVYADSRGNGPPFRQEMERKQQSPADPTAYDYCARATSTRPPTDFTPRIVPYHRLATRLEIDRIIWQK